MLNKIRTELEIFASKVDHLAAKKDQDFLQSFHFGGKFQRKVAGNKGFYTQKNCTSPTKVNCFLRKII
jgi:hypothetical protein